MPSLLPGCLWGVFQIAAPLWGCGLLWTGFFTLSLLCGTCVCQACSKGWDLSVSQAGLSLSAWLPSPARETSGKWSRCSESEGRLSARDQGLSRCLGQEGLSEEVTCRVVYMKFRRRGLNQGKQARPRPWSGMRGHGRDQRGWWPSEWVITGPKEFEPFPKSVEFGRVWG